MTLSTLILATAPPIAAGTADSAANSSMAETMREVGLNPFRLFIQNMPRLDLLNHPDQLLDTLGQLHLVWAGIFITAGLFSVINGYRWHRTIVIVCSFLAGMGIGHAMSQSLEINLIVTGCVGILAAVIAWPLMKYAIAASGGLAGAFLGANLWTALNQPAETHYAGALIGLVAFGLMSFILYKVVIVAMTCITGAFVLVMGAITVLIHVESWQFALRQDFTQNPILIPLLVLVTAVIGFVVQHGELQHSPDKKDSKSAAGKPAPA